MTQTEINIQIGKKSPKEYFGIIKAQCEGTETRLGGITSRADLHANLAAHAIPESVMDMEITDYDDFLAERRKLMAEKIRGYYWAL